MTKLAVLVSVAAISLAVQVTSAIADDVPTYDVSKNCKTDVQAYQGGGNQQGCLADEQNARTTLVGQWSQFTPDSRARRVRLRLRSRLITSPRASLRRRTT